MLLCAIADLEPGMKVGASVPHPRRPHLYLLRPGIALDAEMIRQLPCLGVSEVWIQHDATNLRLAGEEPLDAGKRLAANLDHSVLSGETALDLDRSQRVHRDPKPHGARQGL